MESKEPNTPISDFSDYITPPKPHIKISDLNKSLLLKGEDRKEFEEYRSSLLKELLPCTKIEIILAEKFIISGWKLRRAMVIEKTLLNRQNAITDDERYGEEHPRKRIRSLQKVDLAKDEMRFISQYQLALEKAMHKALERLREEQKLRT